MNNNSKYQHIQDPEGVSSLMRELYGRSLRGENISGNNVFIVDLPSLTEGEKAGIDKPGKNENHKQIINSDSKSSLKTLKYKEVFLKVNPHKVNEAIGCNEVEIQGEKVLFRTEQAFDICKGLYLYATGEKYDVDEDLQIEKIKGANPKLSSIQARVILHGIKGYMGAALDALEFLHKTNRDSMMSQWLNREVSCSSDVDFTSIAVKLISEIINNHNITL